MHAHTGVMSHLLAPRDCGMVARVRVRCPCPGGSAAERGHGSGGNRVLVRVSGGMERTSGQCKKNRPKRMNGESGLNRP